MDAVRRSVRATAVISVCSLLAGVQTIGAIDVMTGSGEVEFAAEGGQDLEVEVFSPSGERVFASDPLTSGAVRWDMRDEQGQPVARGVYLATITVRSSTGVVRKRVEQIVVGAQPQMSAQRSAADPQAVTTITGAGTSGRIARFTGTNTIGNSVIIQSTAGNIGINVTPVAVLQVSKAQPAPLAGNGTNASTLLQTTGGKGGNTTVAGTTAGRGASISLLAGAGGNAVPGSTNGRGGNITLQPGSPGSGGAGGVAGNVLLAPLGGNVGIGTTNPVRPLQIGPGFDAMFTIEPSDVSPNAGFIRFGDYTGWRLHFARSREFSGGPLNTGIDGSLMQLRDDGLFALTHFPLGSIGTRPLCTYIGAITWCQTSSLRYKTDLAPYRSGLDVINRLQPITFTRKQSGVRDVGLAAEDVEGVEPLLTFRNEKGEIEGVKYELLAVVFINALKEQQEQLQRQENVIEELQSRLRRLESAHEQVVSGQ